MFLSVTDTFFYPDTPNRFACKVAISGLEAFFEVLDRNAF